MTNETQSIDVKKFANDTVRLQVEVKAVTSGVEVIDGKVSSTGKTIDAKDPVTGEPVRLDTQKIMSGEYEFRNSMVYELYSPDNFLSAEEINYAPGPQVGVNEYTQANELPEATH